MENEQHDNGPALNNLKPPPLSNNTRTFSFFKQKKISTETPPSTPNRTSTLENITYPLTFDDLNAIDGFKGQVSAHATLPFTLEATIIKHQNYIVIDKNCMSQLFTISNMKIIADLKHKNILYIMDLVNSLGDAYQLAQKGKSISFEDHQYNLKIIANLIINLINFSIKNFTILKNNKQNFLTINSLNYDKLPEAIKNNADLKKDTYNQYIKNIKKLAKEIENKTKNNSISDTNFYNNLGYSNFCLPGYFPHEKLLEFFSNYLNEKYNIKANNIFKKNNSPFAEWTAILSQAIYDICIRKTQNNSPLVKVNSSYSCKNYWLYFKKNHSFINNLFEYLIKVFSLPDNASEISKDIIYNKLDYFSNNLTLNQQKEKLEQTINNWFANIEEQLQSGKEINSDTTVQFKYTKKF